MKRSELDRLSRDILADENLEVLRAASLDGGLARLRTRHRRRAVLSGFATAVVAVAALLFLKSSPSPVAHHVANEAPAVPRIKMIDDQELLALFPDRSVALVGSPGDQKLIFLDAPDSTSSPAKTR